MDGVYSRVRCWLSCVFFYICFQQTEKCHQGQRPLYIERFLCDVRPAWTTKFQKISGGTCNMFLSCVPKICKENISMVVLRGLRSNFTPCMTFERKVGLRKVSWRDAVQSDRQSEWRISCCYLDMVVLLSLSAVAWEPENRRLRRRITMTSTAASQWRRMFQRRSARRVATSGVASATGCTSGSRVPAAGVIERRRRLVVSAREHSTLPLSTLTACKNTEPFLNCFFGNPHSLQLAHILIHQGGRTCPDDCFVHFKRVFILMRNSPTAILRHHFW